MKKLASLIIKDFQSHKDTFVELHEHLNVITGESDTGKSTIIRAIEWVRKNRPLGHMFIGPSGSCSVTLNFMNGSIIYREKGINDNLYRATTENIDEVYRAFSSNVPGEAGKILYTANVCIQRQFEIPYFVFESDITVGKKLAESSGYDVLLRTNQGLRSKLRDERGYKTKLDKRAATIQEELNSSKFKQVALLEELMTEREHEIEKLSRLREIEEDVHSLIVSVRASQDIIDVLSEKAVSLGEIETEHSNEYTHLLELKEAVQEVFELVSSVHDLEIQLKNKGEVLTKMRIELAESLAGYTECPLCNAQIPPNQECNRHEDKNQDRA